MRQEEWSNAGGCSWKHPFNKERRDECNAVALEKKGSKAYVSKSQADSDMLLAQAMAMSASKEDKSWSAGQTLMVAGGAIALLTIMTVVIIKMKKSRK